MQFFNQSSEELATMIGDVNARLQELELARAKSLKREKQYQLLVGLDTFTRQQSNLMPDDMLADKCRETTLFQMFNLIGHKLSFVASLPPELAHKSLAQVLHVLDFIDDDEKLNAIDYQEGLI